MNFIRSVLFSTVYWIASILYVFLAAISLIMPGHQVTSWIVGRYAKRMVQTLRWIAGIRLNVVGKENVPEQCIIAAKHHSWFDGFCMYSQFKEPLAFVTGDHLEKFPLMAGVLRRLGAIVVNNCGGHDARKALADNAARAAANGRRILIYPEGHLSAPGTRHKYRTGVYHMYVNFGLPVVPVATNLGCFAQQQEFKKTSGTATLQFMEPIPPGLSKEEFMVRLEQTIEVQSDILISKALGGNLIESVLTNSDKITIKQAIKNLNSLS
jgi:1-acyl-sn-glycerol-3-phosphate acyltransferase